MEILSWTNTCSDLILEKGLGELFNCLQPSSVNKLRFVLLAMVDSRFSQVNLPLMHMQKDLRLAINMADGLNLPMPVTAIANEGYKNARRLGLSESDASAICYRARH